MKTIVFGMMAIMAIVGTTVGMGPAVDDSWIGDVMSGTAAAAHAGSGDGSMMNADNYEPYVPVFGMSVTNTTVTITGMGDVSGLIIANGNMAVFQFPAGTKAPVEVEVASKFGDELRLTNGVGTYATAVVA